jgi:subtilisin family serine protease
MKPFYLTAPLLIITLFLPSLTFAQAEYPPNQVIVKFHPEQTPTDISTATSIRLKRSTSISGKLINSLEDTKNQLNGVSAPEELLNQYESVAQTIEAQESTPLTTDTTTAIITYSAPADPKDVSDKLESLENVEYAHPNYYVYPFDTVPNDTNYSKQWNLQKIQAPKAWDLAKGNNTVKIAILDSGLNYTHEDLDRSRIVLRRNFISDNDDPTDSLSGHGSNVTGIIAATSNNSKGISGVTWNSSLYIYKVIGLTGNLDDVLAAMDMAIADGVNVMNMSIGFSAACSQAPSLQDAINRAYNAKITIVAAAGNDAKDANNTSPASCNNIITVASTNFENTRSSFSNYGSTIEIAAPGGDGDDNTDINNFVAGVHGASNTQYSLFAGTSQSAPHVSAAAALLLSKNPNLTPDQIKNILVSSGDAIQTDQPIGPRLNLYKALQQISATNTPTKPATTNTPMPILTDLDGDKDTDYKDLRILMKNYSKSGSGNFNTNGQVDSFDFAYITKAKWQ